MRTTIPLPRVVVVWHEGKVEDNWVCFRRPKPEGGSEFVACSAVDFFQTYVFGKKKGK